MCLCLCVHVFVCDVCACVCYVCVCVMFVCLGAYLCALVFDELNVLYYLCFMLGLFYLIKCFHFNNINNKF